MDPLETLAVRFHMNGEFVHSGGKLHYVGGDEAMSYIDRDKISYPEVMGYLRDHLPDAEGVLLHWLFPGKELTDGLEVLWDDSSCLKMGKYTEEGCVAEVYVEARQDGDDEDNAESSESDFEAELDKMAVELSSDDESQEGQVTIAESREEAEKQITKLKAFYSSPSKGAESSGKKKGQCFKAVQKRKGKGVATADEGGHGGTEENEEEGGSSSDSDYLPGDECASDEDDEQEEILKKFKQFKKKLKRGEAAQLDDVILGGGTGTMPAGFDDIDDDDNETEYVDSDDGPFEDIGSDGELNKKDSSFPKFKKSKNVPKFSLGMRFSTKKDFKKAVMKYALAERRVMDFVKDDKKRVRVACEWPTCPWVILLSDNSRNQGWQIVTFQDFHTCPPRRDNKHVTAKRIAQQQK